MHCVVQLRKISKCKVYHFNQKQGINRGLYEENNRLVVHAKLESIETY